MNELAQEQALAAGFTADQRALLAKLDEKASASKGRTWLAVIATIAIIGGLLIAVVVLATQVRATEQARAKADALRIAAVHTAAERKVQIDDDLRKFSQARAAFDRRDFREVATVLNTLYDEAKVEAQVVTATADRVATPTVTIPNTLPTPVATPAAVQSRQNVYIQFAGIIDRAQIVQLNQSLRNAGWNVRGPSGERTEHANRLNEVRYHGQADRLAAEALARAVTGAGIGKGVVVAKQFDAIYDGTLEVWISRT